MSEPNLNCNEWPKTATGNVDWETLFEDPETGLIAYIENAGVPLTLRVNAVQVIQSLFTRKDDGDEVDRLSSEISELIPDEMPKERFPIIARAVVQAMREIKDQRIKKALAYDRQKEAGGSERRGAKAKGLSIKKLIHRRQTYMAGGIAASLIILAAAAYLFIPWPKKAETANLSRGLLVQMEYAATGGAPATHVYGGPLRSERKLGDVAVVAGGVPKSACVEVGASLASTGRLMINSLRPEGRNRPAVARLCNKVGSRITFRWVPDNQ